MDGAKKWFRLSFDWRRFRNNLSFIVQFTFAYMGTVANMQFTRCWISRKRSGYSLVVCSALLASLLRMSAFGIWHNSKILNPVPKGILGQFILYCFDSCF